MLLRELVSLILDDQDDTFPAWSSAPTNYHNWVAHHIEQNDPETMRDIEDLVHRIRTHYRTFKEYSNKVQSIPVTKTLSEDLLEKIEQEDCPICLHALKGMKTIVKTDPCKHLMHGPCLRKIRPVEGKIMCPVCRCDLGPPPASTTDLE